MRILISGGTGMIGRALTASLLADEHQIWVLTRSPQAAGLMHAVQPVGWDGSTPEGWGDLINRIDAVVNLAGERLARWPWTQEFKRRIWDSRVDGGRALADAIRKAAHRPQVFIQASGVNYYGPRGLEPITEAGTPGEDFLGRLCQAWEDATRPVEEMGVRRAIIRSAIVLSARDGILPILSLPVRLFLGGPLGSGSQGLPWIHIDDEIAAIRFLLDNASAAGPFNLTAPQPVSSREFIRQLAGVMRRPCWLPIPAFGLRFLLGGMSTLVLAGQYLLPEQLLKLGFHFKFDNLKRALQDLLE